VAVLPTFDMLLFGGTGDLVTRKLLPALYRRYVAGQVSAESRVVGMARSGLSRGDYLTQAESACRGFLGKESDPALKGNLTLFMCRDELDAGPKAYIAGSWGPAGASSLIGRDGFAWHGEL